MVLLHSTSADFPFAGALAKYLLSAEYTAMPTLLIDSQTRLAIAQVILKNTDQCQTITLPNGARLRVLSHCENIAFELIDDDLFDQHLDVSDQVIRDMECSSDWVWLFR